MSEDHFIVAQRVTQNKSDNQALVPLVEEVERQCGERPRRVLADCGFFSNQNLREMEERGIEAYVPDPNLARELNTGKRARGVGRMKVAIRICCVHARGCAAPTAVPGTKNVREWSSRCSGLSRSSVGCGSSTAAGSRPRRSNGAGSGGLQLDALPQSAPSSVTAEHTPRSCRKRKTSTAEQTVPVPLRRSTPTLKLRHRLLRVGLTSFATPALVL